MKALQPLVHPPPHARRHLLQQLAQFHRSQAVQDAHVHMPERLGFADQPGPGTGGLPTAQPIQQGIPLVGAIRRQRRAEHGETDQHAPGCRPAAAAATAGGLRRSEDNLRIPQRAATGASGVVVVGFVGERLHFLPADLLASDADADDLLSIEVGDLYHHAVGNHLTAV